MIQRWLAIAGALGAVLLSAFLYGRKSAQADEAKQQLRTVREARKVENEVDNLNGADVNSRLSRWMRK